MELSTQAKILIEQRITNEKKSLAMAYLLLIFLGPLGMHRFYLGKTGSGFVMLALSLIGWASLVVVVGVVFLAVVGIWVVVDAFLLPEIVRQDQERLRQKLTLETMASLSPDHA
ncbi:MAG: TM2 domain-containing protein [Hyphomicrobiales bacterium]